MGLLPAAMRPSGWNPSSTRTVWRIYKEPSAAGGPAYRKRRLGRKASEPRFAARRFPGISGPAPPFLSVRQPLCRSLQYGKMLQKAGFPIPCPVRAEENGHDIDETGAGSRDLAEELYGFGFRRIRTVVRKLVSKRLLDRLLLSLCLSRKRHRRGQCRRQSHRNDLGRRPKTSHSNRHGHDRPGRTVTGDYPAV